MSSIPNAVTQVLRSREAAAAQQVQMALLRKRLDTQQQTGEAINQLIEQAVEIQRQLSENRLDIRV